MKQIEEIILKSLSCHIHDQNLNENFSVITNKQSHEIYQLSKIHSIIPIVYEALKDNSSFLQNDQSLQQKWYQKKYSTYHQTNSIYISMPRYLSKN